MLEWWNDGFKGILLIKNDFLSTFLPNIPIFHYSRDSIECDAKK
jgi:hypothetical protein